jgi:DNA (cytosine-5)-methyltransferase 1
MPAKMTSKQITVHQAIADLPQLNNGASIDYLHYPCKAKTDYARTMRNGSIGCTGHLVSKNASWVTKRYKFIPQGGNWQCIPVKFMKNYSDRMRCHTGIYRRLMEDRPSVVLGNYRKNMLIHPVENRGLSVREAARLQSFPDWYEFKGSIGFQQQQVANAVPPLLAKAIFMKVIEAEL